MLMYSTTGQRIKHARVEKGLTQDELAKLAIVVINGDEGTLKKVHIQTDAIILESANPMFPARVFTGVDRAIVHIVGKVIEIRRILA